MACGAARAERAEALHPTTEKWQQIRQRIRILAQIAHQFTQGEETMLMIVVHSASSTVMSSPRRGARASSRSTMAGASGDLRSVLRKAVAARDLGSGTRSGSTTASSSVGSAPIDRALATQLPWRLLVLRAPRRDCPGPWKRQGRTACLENRSATPGSSSASTRRASENAAANSRWPVPGCARWQCLMKKVCRASAGFSRSPYRLPWSPFDLA